MPIEFCSKWNHSNVFTLHFQTFPIMGKSVIRFCVIQILPYIFFSIFHCCLHSQVFAAVSDSARFIHFLCCHSFSPIRMQLLFFHPKAPKVKSTDLQPTDCVIPCVPQFDSFELSSVLKNINRFWILDLIDGNIKINHYCNLALSEITLLIKKPIIQDLSMD